MRCSQPGLSVAVTIVASRGRVAELGSLGREISMNATLLRNVGFAFLVNLAWVAGIMYAGIYLDPLNEYLGFALYWVLPLCTYLLILERSRWMGRLHRVLRTSIFALMGFGLSALASIAVGCAYSLALLHALKKI